MHAHARAGKRARVETFSLSRYYAHFHASRGTKRSATRQATNSSTTRSASRSRRINRRLFLYRHRQGGFSNEIKIRCSYGARGCVQSERFVGPALAALPALRIFANGVNGFFQVPAARGIAVGKFRQEKRAGWGSGNVQGQVRVLEGCGARYCRGSSDLA